jgi:CubicO group peptidase (beta-lactamase class C family)
VTTGHIDGHVATGFGKVADAFADNFRSRGETGAACVIYAGGAPVVDIWAGTTGRGPWTPTTRSVLFSVSKAITTICLLMAAEEGLLDLDAPVVTYWPEYEANGKQNTTVRQVLAHRAGLPAPDSRLTVAELAAWQPVADSLARQTPLWPPGTDFAYHALTVGWLAGEILRRATGERPAQWLQQHMANPLQLSAIGFGADLNSADFAAMLEQLPIEDLDGAAALVPADIGLVDRSMTMNGALGSGAGDLFSVANTRDFLSLELPAGNLVSTARDLARLFAATTGPVDGVQLLSGDTIRDACVPRSFGKSYLGVDDGNRWGTGFMLHSTRRGMAGPGSYGHDGAGGQLGFAHHDLGIGFGYQTIRPGGFPDNRAEALCNALRTCI